MRLLLVGAFAYPHALGSQIYFQEQAIALRAAGAEVQLLTYGPPRPSEDERALPHAGDPDRWRALDGFDHIALPAWAAPSSRRSGPNLGKPFADLCLAIALRRTLRASLSTKSAVDRASSASRSGSSMRFDAILAHHAEAALAALHGLPRARPPIVYCAHTLLEQELPEYAKSPLSKSFFGSSGSATRVGEAAMTRAPVGRALARSGRVIDRWLACRADAWIALTQSAESVISASSSRPGRLIAPPLADPRSDPERPTPAEVARAHGLVADRFLLYAGNLDPYQDLPLLERVAWERAAHGSRSNARIEAPLPIVIATHDERTAAQRGAGGKAAGVRVLRVRTAAEMNALVAAARATIVPRRTVGGFPIKLLNSLAAGTTVVAFHGAEWGLVHQRDSLICDLERPEASLYRALELLESDRDLAVRLAAGARATWCARHQPARVAADTIALIEKLA